MFDVFDVPDFGSVDPEATIGMCVSDPKVTDGLHTHCGLSTEVLDCIPTFLIMTLNITLPMLIKE